MPSATNQKTRRNGDIQETAGWGRRFGLEATHDAQEAVGRSLRATVDSFSAFSEVTQRVSREIVALSVEGAKEAFRFYAELQGSTLDALQSGFGGWSASQPFLQSWQRLLDGSAKAFGRFAESLQGTAEAGTERIKEAVEAMADQVKETSAQLGELGDTVEDRPARSTASASRAATRS
jgi:hypothetical protein